MLGAQKRERREIGLPLLGDGRAVVQRKTLFLPDAAAAACSYCGGEVSFLAQVLIPIHA